MDYFELVQAFPDYGRWYLGGVFADSGAEMDTGAFLRGERVDFDLGRLPLVGGAFLQNVPLPLSIELRRPGTALDFTLGDFDLPVVRKPLSDAIAVMVKDDVQRIPARIRGCEERFDILNVTRSAPCLDLNQSEIEWITERGPGGAAVRRPFAIYQMVIDPAAAASCHMFRLTAWMSAIIVSAPMRALIEQIPNLGVGFEKVTR